jgi:hypothetical protein
MRFLPNAKRAWLLQRLPWDVALPLHEGLEAIVGMTSSFTVAALLRNPQVRGRLPLCRLLFSFLFFFFSFPPAAPRGVRDSRADTTPL